MILYRDTACSEVIFLITLMAVSPLKPPRLTFSSRVQVASGENTHKREKAEMNGHVLRIFTNYYGVLLKSDELDIVC